MRRLQVKRFKIKYRRYSFKSKKKTAFGTNFKSDFYWTDTCNGYLQTWHRFLLDSHSHKIVDWSRCTEQIFTIVKLFNSSVWNGKKDGVLTLLEYSIFPLILSEFVFLIFIYFVCSFVLWMNCCHLDASQLCLSTHSFTIGSFVFLIFFQMLH